MDEIMTEKVYAVGIIDIYFDLLRIEKAQGEEKDKEIKNQLRKDLTILADFRIITRYVCTLVARVWLRRCG